MATNLTIGFLGAGKMATALARGFIHAELVGPKDMVAADPIAAARNHFADEIGISPVASNLAVVKAAGVLILAVKPDQCPGVLAELSNTFTNRHLLISIAAGVTLAKLEGALPAAMEMSRWRFVNVLLNSAKTPGH